MTQHLELKIDLTQEDVDFLASIGVEAEVGSDSTKTTDDIAIKKILQHYNYLPEYNFRYSCKYTKEEILAADYCLFWGGSSIGYPQPDFSGAWEKNVYGGCMDTGCPLYI